MAAKASHDRQGSHAGRGFRYQDAVAAWLSVRVWAGIDSPCLIIPEGNDDVERRFATGSHLVQVKSRREDLGFLPIADARTYIRALWERHDMVAPTPAGLELVVERPLANHDTGADGRIALQAALTTTLPGGSRVASLLSKTAIMQVPDPSGTAIEIISERTGCSPLAAQICYANILARCGSLADENGRRTPASYQGMSPSDTEAAINGMLGATDIDQLELAVRSGAVEPVDFINPLDDPDFYLGVDVQPGHVAAGLVIPRSAPREALVNGLEARGAALIAGPSGSGKSAIMWETAHSLRHTVRWYRLLRVDSRDMAAIRQMLKTLRADPGSPVGLIVDDVGRRGAAAWDALTRELAAISGAVLLGSIREEDLFLLEGRSRSLEVRAEPDPELAKRIFEKLKESGRTEWAGWKEPWTLSQGLVLEYVHLLTAGERFEDTLGEQVAARRRDPARDSELAVLRVLSLVGAAGATGEVSRIVTALGVSEESLARDLSRLINEHLVTKTGEGLIAGLHQLRSSALVALTHAVPPPSIATTFARAALIVSPPDLEALTADAIRNRGVDIDLAIAALVDRLTQDPDIEVLSAILRGLGTAHIAVSADRWLAMPHASALVPTQVGSAVMFSLVPNALPALNEMVTLINSAAADLAAIRSDHGSDPRLALLDTLPPHYVDRLLTDVRDPIALNGLLAAQMGLPLHPSIRSPLSAMSLDLFSDPLEQIVELLGTLAEIDRPLAQVWVDAVGENNLVRRIPAEVPWATGVLFEEASDGRVIRCDYRHIGLPDAGDTHGEVVRICETALALSPRSDIAASTAVNPDDSVAGFNGHNLAEKRIPRENAPTAALPAWNRRWRDAIAIRVAAPSYTQYLSQAAKLADELASPLERFMDSLLRRKLATDKMLAPMISVAEAAQALTPPAIAPSLASGEGSTEFNPHVSKIQSVLFDSSTDLIRRFKDLPEGAAAYISWTGDLLKRIDDASAEEPWSIVGGVPPSLASLRTTINAAREIAGGVASKDLPPAQIYSKLIKGARSGNAVRVVATTIANGATRARRNIADEIRSGLVEAEIDAQVLVVEDAEALLPWPPSKALVLISIASVEDLLEFYVGVARAREICPEFMRLIAMPTIDGIALPSMGHAGYETMLPLADEAAAIVDKFGISSSPSLAWSTFDRTAAFASALQSMDRLGLGTHDRPADELEKRGELENAIADGRTEVEEIFARLDPELAQIAQMYLDQIGSGEAGYADAASAVASGGEMAPILEQLLGLRILIEQAELDALGAGSSVA